MSRHSIAFLHGINSDGTWHSEAMKVLRHHFECRLVPYHHYERFGATKLILEPLVLAVGFAPLAVWAGMALLTSKDLAWLPFSVLVVVVSGIAYATTGLRQRKALKAVKQGLDDLRRGRPSTPHIIAHSFGSFLFERVLEAYRDVAADRVVLIGSVMRSDFAWSTVLNDRRARCVWNEISSDDRVVQLAMWARKLVRVGSAGVTGFTGTEGPIYCCPDPKNACSTTRLLQRAVHNVDFSGYDHHTSLTGSGHARMFWLPFLWGIRPVEYEAFSELCLLAYSAWHDGRYGRLKLAEEELRDFEGSWLGNSLAETIAHEVQHYNHRLGRIVTPAAVDADVDSVIAGMWRVFGDADLELIKEAPDSAVVEGLSPIVALKRALDGILPDEAP